MTALLASGVPPVSFHVHVPRTGSIDGARAEFEQMIAQLIKVTMPSARQVAANPGDWGIDVYVGHLGEQIGIWQSKYFIPHVTKNHQQEIRDSFKSARLAAEAHEYTLASWALCVPSSLDAPTSQWWDGWKKRESRKHGVLIELWDETELRDKLASPEAANVRRLYYDPYSPPGESEPALSVTGMSKDEADALDGALFVRQLLEAGHAETDAAKRQFFNADLLARDVINRGIERELTGLATADAVAHALWEHNYNLNCQTCSTAQLPRLHLEVMTEIRDAHPEMNRALRMSLIHAWGLVHRLVEEGRAGWVRHWRDVAEDHRAAWVETDEENQSLEPPPNVEIP